MNVLRSATERWLALVTACLTIALVGSSSFAALVSKEGPNEHRDRLQGLNKPTAGPVLEVRVHKVGNIQLCVTNYGIFGNQADPSIKDPETGLSAPSCVYPAGSGIEYLFQGALWVGAIVNEDTLVSHGHDGWQHIFEFYADQAPRGSMIKRTIRKSEPEYSAEAISEADYLAVYTDTLTDQAFVAQNPEEGRPHVPIGIEITQKSYSWSYSYAEDFILLDFVVKNIGIGDIRKAYMGIYVDADVGHLSTGNYFQDDICGFKAKVPSPACPDLEDIINVAWIADNDGDPNKAGVFDGKSPTAVTGTRVVRTPNPELQTSFNWWVSQGDAKLDWGPIKQANNRGLGTGGLGTPAGDENKYFFMSNGEFDYDQLYSGVDYSSAGWLPPNTQIAEDLADGYDTRYLLSFGPFDIAPGDSLPITMAYIGGDKFHVRPNDFEYFNAESPDEFANRLDFGDLATNAQWAGWVYDNPGVDTDGDGKNVIDPATDPVLNPCTGDLVYRFGDGVPDFKGPPPPTPPSIRFSAEPGKITLRWNGKESETGEDPFSFLKDFEGYRVYMGSRPLLSEFALLTSFDFENYNRYRLNTSFSPPRWELTEVPFSLDSLKSIFGDDFNPMDWTSQADSLPGVDEEGNVTAYYFTIQDYNRSEINQPGTIAKVYPNAVPGQMVWAEDLQDSVEAYYEYEFEIEGLLPSRPQYFAVTTLDYGNPSTNLAALESSPLANAIETYPIFSADQVEKQKLDVVVFPNPYRIDGGYLEAGYEQLSAVAASPERARRLHFANLPSEATIKIFTLDGDLVRELEHPCGCPLQEGESMMSWDLITRNTQAAVSGIYLYTVESALGTQVGKFVVIK